MNRREAGDEGFHKPRRVSNCFKDRDEELSFFRDLKKRDEDQAATLLHPAVSEEFEPNGEHYFYIYIFILILGYIRNSLV